MLRIARVLGVSRAALWMLRVETEARWLKLVARLWPPAIFARRRLQRQRNLLLNVACGPFVADGFVNLDLRRYADGVFPWDCRRSLPVADGSCSGIRIEHFLEHLDPRDELPRLLAECHRALAPGGVLRIIVPDTARYLRAYVEGGRRGFDALAIMNPFPDDLPTPLDIVNHVFHQWHEHRWAFDEENLSWRLREAGFDGVSVTEFRQSQLPALGAADRDEHAVYSLYVDCVKTAASARQAA